MSGIDESEFYMWRTLFAMAHVDGYVSPQEVRFMVEALEDVPFSKEQRNILVNDISEPQNIEDMFAKISNAKSQAEFFKFAREIVWADGEYGKEEQEIMLRLKEIHVRRTDVDDLVGAVELEFDENYSWEKKPDKKDKKKMVFAFRDQFMRHRGA